VKHFLSIRIWPGKDLPRLFALMADLGHKEKRKRLSPRKRLNPDALPDHGPDLREAVAAHPRHFEVRWWQLGGAAVVPLSAQAIVMAHAIALCPTFFDNPSLAV